MRRIRFDLPIDRPLRGEEIDKLNSLIPYCGEGILQWSIQNEAPVSIECNLSEEADEEAVRALLRSAFQYSQNTWELSGTVVFDQMEVTPPNLMSSDASPGDEWFIMGDGLMVFGPTFAKVVSALDRKILTIAARYEAEELLVPALIPGAKLNQAGYPRNFPHHIASVNILPHNLNQLKDFTSAEETNVDSFQFSGNFLLPAACLGCYNYFSDQKISESYTFTVVAQCSRYEAKRMTTPVRLWNFRMREIVHLGSPESAFEFRKEVLQVLISFLGKLGLPVRIAAANDPFFADYGYAIANYQKTLELKYEIQARLPNVPGPLAIGSLNLHQDFFGKNFNIQDQKGQNISSSCIAFGLERWAYWLISWLGTNTQDWPDDVREAIGF